MLGIAVTYSVLGVIAALTGGLFGAALQSPWVNVGLGLLFVVLSLSMFGLYEMQPPTWVLQRLGGADATSLLGIFLVGARGRHHRRALRRARSSSRCWRCWRSAATRCSASRPCS